MEKCVLCLRDSLIKSFEERESQDSKQKSSRSTTNSAPRQTTVITGDSENELVILDPAVYASPEYAQAAVTCSASCNGTVIDTTRVKLVDSGEQKDDSNLCIIYTDDNCRVFFTYRYSDAIYLNRKVSSFHHFYLLRSIGR